MTITKSENVEMTSQISIARYLGPPSSTTNTISNSEFIDNCDTQIIMNDCLIYWYIYKWMNWISNDQFSSTVFPI